MEIFNFFFNKKQEIISACFFCSIFFYIHFNRKILNNFYLLEINIKMLFLSLITYYIYCKIKGKILNYVKEEIGTSFFKKNPELSGFRTLIKIPFFSDTSSLFRAILELKFLKTYVEETSFFKFEDNLKKFEEFLNKRKKEIENNQKKSEQSVEEQVDMDENTIEKLIEENIFFINKEIDKVSKKEKSEKDLKIKIEEIEKYTNNLKKNI